MDLPNPLMTQAAASSLFSKQLPGWGTMAVTLSDRPLAWHQRAFARTQRDMTYPDTGHVGDGVKFADGQPARLHPEISQARTLVHLPAPAACTKAANRAA